MDSHDFSLILVDLQLKEYEVEVAVISERWCWRRIWHATPPMLRTPVGGKNDQTTCRTRGTLRNLGNISYENQKDLQ